MAYAVQHHLGHRLLAADRLAGGLEIDCLGHAVQGARTVVGVGLEHEGAHGPDRQAGEGAKVVHRHGAVAFLGGESQIGDLAQVEVCPTLRPPP